MRLAPSNLLQVGFFDLRRLYCTDCKCLYPPAIKKSLEIKKDKNHVPSFGLLDDLGIVDKHLVFVSRAEVLVLQKDAGDSYGLPLDR